MDAASTKTEFLNIWKTLLFLNARDIVRILLKNYEKSLLDFWKNYVRISIKL